MILFDYEIIFYLMLQLTKFNSSMAHWKVKAVSKYNDDKCNDKCNLELHAQLLFIL